MSSLKWKMAAITVGAAGLAFAGAYVGTGFVGPSSTRYVGPSSAGYVGTGFVGPSSTRYVGPSSAGYVGPGFVGPSSTGYVGPGYVAVPANIATQGS
jgi:hypothetical protein